jgi:hypothetical protein
MCSSLDTLNDRGEARSPRRSMASPLHGRNSHAKVESNEVYDARVVPAMTEAPAKSK